VRPSCAKLRRSKFMIASMVHVDAVMNATMLRAGWRVFWGWFSSSIGCGCGGCGIGGKCGQGRPGKLLVDGAMEGVSTMGIEFAQGF